MLKIFDAFSLIWVLKYTAFQSLCFYNFLQVTLNFWLQQRMLVVKSNFAHSFAFYDYLTTFTISINLWWMVSLRCELFQKLAFYTLKNDQRITNVVSKMQVKKIIDIILKKISILKLMISETHQWHLEFFNQYFKKRFV